MCKFDVVFLVKLILNIYSILIILKSYQYNEQ